MNTENGNVLRWLGFDSLTEDFIGKDKVFVGKFIKFFLEFFILLLIAATICDLSVLVSVNT
jgi:hypothetical protein